MRFRARLVTPLLVVVILSACAAGASPTAIGTPAPPTSSTAADDENLRGYTATICPVFDALGIIDPRLNDLRAVAQEGGGMAAEEESMAALSDGILVILDELETLPDWQPGAALRFHLTNSLHGIRTRLLRAGRDPGASDAASGIVGMPFIATDELDRAMAIASQGGLACPSGL